MARGDLGECGVRRGLEAMGVEYDHSLNFRAGADGGGRTVQVDILARLPNGHLAVVEVKAYSGTITGKAAEEQWVHNGHPLLNPVVQGRWQSAALKARMGLQQAPHVLVVTTGSAAWPPHPQIVPLRQMARALRPLLALPPVNTAAAWVAVRRDLHDDAVAVEHVERMRSRSNP